MNGENGMKVSWFCSLLCHYSHPGVLSLPFSMKKTADLWSTNVWIFALLSVFPSLKTLYFLPFMLIPLVPLLFPILLDSPSSILPLPIRSTLSTLINFPTSWREIKPIPILPKSLSETNQQESKTLRNSPAVELLGVPIKSRKSSFRELTQSSRKYTASVFVRCKRVK